MTGKGTIGTRKRRGRRLAAGRTLAELTEITINAIDGICDYRYENDADCYDLPHNCRDELVMNVGFLFYTKSMAIW